MTTPNGEPTDEEMVLIVRAAKAEIIRLDARVGLLEQRLEKLWLWCGGGGDMDIEAASEVTGWFDEKGGAR